MSRFIVRSVDNSFRSAEMIATDAGAALYAISQLNLREADVLQDDRYLFSAYVNRHGMWCIFQRAHGVEVEADRAHG